MVTAISCAAMVKNEAQAMTEGSTRTLCVIRIDLRKFRPFVESLGCYTLYGRIAVSTVMQVPWRVYAVTHISVTEMAKRSLMMQQNKRRRSLYCSRIQQYLPYLPSPHHILLLPSCTSRAQIATSLHTSTIYPTISPSSR